MSDDDDSLLSSEQQKTVLLIVGVVIAAVATPMILMPNSANAPDAGVSTPTPSKGTVQTFESTPATGDERSVSEAKLRSVPDSHISEMANDRGDDGPPEPTGVQASAGTQTMQIETTSVDGEPALVLSDDRTHDGRWVSVSTAWLQEVHGEVPTTVTIRHESGDVYSEKVRVRGGSAAFYVRGFSSNTVTFSGEVSVSSSSATDGTQFQYEVADLDAASDVTVNMTGVSNAEWDNVSRDGVGNGETVSLDISGTTDPTGPGGEPSVTFRGLPRLHNPATDLGDGTTGGVEPGIGDDNSGDPIKASFVVQPSEDLTVKELRPYITGIEGSDYSPSVDIYLSSGKADTTWQEGTLIKSGWSPDWATGRQSVTLDTTTTLSAGEFYEIELITTSASGDGSADTLELRASQSGSESSTFVETDYNTNTESGVWVDAVLVGEEGRGTDPGIDIDGDGTAEASVSGTLAAGETATRSLSGLTTADDTVEVSLSSGAVDVSVSLKEVTQTQDAGVVLNNESVSYAGTLAEGETVQRTINKSAIAEGTNVVNVTVGDGSLSNDAPEPQLKFELSHDAADRQSVQYAAEQWTSRYNVSKSYASRRGNATLTIPFDSSDVVSMRAVEVRYNGTSWSSMSSSNYALNGTELTADLSAAYGGDIPAGTTVEVRANASKVEPINGSVTIVEATDVGQPLNTEIEVNSAATGFRIETPSSEIHYAHNASYESGEYWVADQQGQRLHLPDAQSSDTLRVSTLPVIADPVAGDVHVTVANTSATEPAIAIEPGQSDGNAVDYTFVDALDGETYSLWSTTYQIVRDEGTASSPLTLTDDDSTETLKWLLAANSTSSSDSGGDSARGGLPMGQPEGTDWLPLLAVALALGGLVVASRNSDAVTDAGSDTASGVEGALEGIPVVGTVLGSVLSGVIQGGAQLVRAAVENRTIALALGAAIFWGAVQGGIIELPEGSTVIILVAGLAGLSAVGLYETGQFDIRVWGGIVVATAATAAIIFSSADPIAAITNSGLFPLIAIGGAYLVYEALQAARKAASTPDETTELVIETDGGEK